MAQVLPWLWLGGKRDAKNEAFLKKNGVKRVLNVTP